MKHCYWPLASIDDALRQLSKSQLKRDTWSEEEDELPCAEYPDPERFIEASALRRGLRLQTLSCRSDELSAMLSQAPALLQVKRGGALELIPVLKVAGKKMWLLGTDHLPRVVKRQRVEETLLENARQTCLEAHQADRVSKHAADPEHELLRAALLADRLARVNIKFGWCLQAPVSANIWKLFGIDGLARTAMWFLLLRILAVFFGTCNILLLGYFSIHGVLWRHGFLVWASIVFATICCRNLSQLYQIRLSQRAGVLIRRKIMHGCLAMDLERAKSRGASQALSKILEIEAFEAFGLNGIFTFFNALVDIIFAIVLLSMGTAPLLLVALFLAWLGFAIWQAGKYRRAYRRWTRMRHELSDDLAEQIMGFRTLVTQMNEHQHAMGHDKKLDLYRALLKDLNKLSLYHNPIIPRVWLSIGYLVLLASALMATSSLGSMAISFYAILVGYGAFLKWGHGVNQLVGASAAWEAVGPLFLKDQTDALSSSAPVDLPVLEAEARPAALFLNNLFFRYRGRQEHVLRGCSLKVDTGDRIMIEAHSGQGKSTLASVIKAMHQPTSGLVLYDGLDRWCLGQNLGQRLGFVPQFNENHIFSGSLAFNLLLGRAYPPKPEDLRDATKVCRQLGLGYLLDKMPMGLNQPVGDAGWQFSDGEKSRIFLARTLLQDAETVILDESFIALDPGNVARSLELTLKSKKTIIYFRQPTSS